MRLTALSNLGAIAGLDTRGREGTCFSPAIAFNERASLSGWAIAMIACDLAGSIIIGLIVFRAYVGPFYDFQTRLILALLGFVFSWVLASSTTALYSKKTLLGDQGWLVLKGLVSCAIAFGILLLLEFVLKRIGDVSRVWFLTWAAAVFVWVTSLRFVWFRHLTRFFRRGGCLERALVLADGPRSARGIADTVKLESGGRVGIALATSIPGTPDGPTVEWIEGVIRDDKIDRVIIAQSVDAIAQSEALVQRLARVAVDVTVIPHLGGLRAPVRGVDRIGMLPAIELHSRPLTATQAALKRTEDLVIAGSVLLILAPLLLVIAAAIKIDSRGPVFFRQEREGYHNRPFWLWKFRTMYHAERDPDCLRQTSRDDARVTRVGRTLRRLSLDELPQLINVLWGEMSIIGPRPHALGMTAVGIPMHQVLAEYPARHRLKPGITGWAQVSGCRGEIDTHEKLRRRVSLDCYYIDNWSLSLDMLVIIRTAALLLFDADAY